MPSVTMWWCFSERLLAVKLAVTSFMADLCQLGSVEAFCASMWSENVLHILSSAGADHVASISVIMSGCRGWSSMRWP